ncbi:hypothetical protein LNQ81_15105 [Myroides sp. M-43]|uniref:HD domain-containing protein n=1 Tax=Myroides oncorhynchi TaxID=2893756 RepID=UPI001E3810E5|nr:hypothetical protein [Myroides oncorhynchi]MCC9044003.1 hypothetical protein [Myroides oncorhynchi]
MPTTLKHTYLSLLTKYSLDKLLINELWQEVENSYSSVGRHYHTLIHLESILLQLTVIKDKIDNWDAMLFTLFYHDIVYDVLQSDNEERSAEIALDRMRQLSVPKSTIELCQIQILATKSHSTSLNDDINYFLDADLSILGQSFDLYTKYFKEVRKEYLIYLDDVYNLGRLKVLKHIISMDKIFKTAYYYDKFEAQARDNIGREIEILSSVNI